MKLREAINKIDRSEKNSCSVKLEDLSQDMFGRYLGYPEKENTRIKAFFLAKEYCTDTWVGVRIYFFDDEPIGMSLQPYRKSSEDFSWISEEYIKKVYEYVMSLYEPELPKGTIMDKDELEKEIGLGHKVEYGDRLLTDSVIYEPTGENVSVVKKWRDMKDIDNWSKVKIKFENKEERVVDVSEIIVPFCIK